MNNDNTINTSNEYGRPRRPNPETVSYLRSLPLDEDNEALAVEQVCDYVEAYKAYVRRRTSCDEDCDDDGNHRSNDHDKRNDQYPPEFPPLLNAAHSALSSIYHELASLSCEESCSRRIEILVRMLCRYSGVAKRVVVAAFNGGVANSNGESGDGSGYWVFLSSHRFGSHVAQTALRCVVAECEFDLDGMDWAKERSNGTSDNNGGDDYEQDLEQYEGKMIIDDAYGSLFQRQDETMTMTAVTSSSVTPSLSTLPSLPHSLLRTLREITPFSSDLAVHVCGTHVLRTGLCILAGVEFVDAFHENGGEGGDWYSGSLAMTRRGKFKDDDKKKKKKKKKSSVSSLNNDSSGHSSRQEVTVMKDIRMMPDLKTNQFRKEADILLKEMVEAISLSERKERRKSGSRVSSGRDRDSAAANEKVLPPGELQQRTCHPSAGPLLVQMLRLLSHRDINQSGSSNPMADRRLGILPPDPKYSLGSEAEALVNRLLCWDPSLTTFTKAKLEKLNSGDDDGDQTSQTTGQSYAPDIIYGLSGEPRGSILLETIFRCCPDSFHHELCEVGGFYTETALTEYIYHGVSNYVVQSLLQSVRSREQCSKLVKSLCGIVEDGSILNGVRTCVGENTFKSSPNEGDTETNTDANNNFSLERHANIPRMGVIWRACEMCAKWGSSQDQEQLVRAILRGYASSSGGGGGGSKANQDGNERKKKRSKVKGMSVEDCIPHLLGLTPSIPSPSGSNQEEHNSSFESICSQRLTLDAAGARALYHIFHFSQRIRSDWVNGLVNVYGCNDLVRIANDGLASRCMMDALLDGPSKSHASKLLLAKLLSSERRLAFLATERVGHHVVLKLFRALPCSDEKAMVSADLSRSLNKLGSNAMGRSVMSTCIVKEYLEGETIWKEALAKQKEKEGWLEEILGEKMHCGDVGDREDVSGHKREHKKRKRGGDDGDNGYDSKKGLDDSSPKQNSPENTKRKKDKKEKKKHKK